MAYIDIASDLHAEMNCPDMQWPTDAHDSDLLLAGDVGRIASGSWLVALTAAAAHYRHTYVVLGNHEYYNSTRHTTAELEARAHAEAAALPNVTLLQRDVAVTAEGIAILGCTLWSDTRGHEATVEKAVADYRLVWTVGDNGHGSSKRRVVPADTSAWWERDAAWLTATLAEQTRPAIVLTHHGPHLRLNPPQYARSLLTAAFVSHVPLPRAKVLFSVSGHTHGRLRVTTEQGVPCIAHCLGYRGEFVRGYAPLRVSLSTGDMVPVPVPISVPDSGANMEDVEFV